MEVKGFRGLEAWKQSMDLVEQCYKVTRRFPRDERFGLSSQMRRAAVSIPSNVAEGHSRKTTPAYAHHVSIASGSNGELETCMVLAERLGYVSPQDAAALVARCSEIGRILSGLFASLELKIRADEESRARCPHCRRKP